MCGRHIAGWMVDLDIIEKISNSVVFPLTGISIALEYGMCAIPGWLVDFGFYKKKKTKFLMCGRHIAGWMVDLWFLTKKSNCVCAISLV